MSVYPRKRTGNLGLMWRTKQHIYRVPTSSGNNTANIAPNTQPFFNPNIVYDSDSMSSVRIDKKLSYINSNNNNNNNNNNGSDSDGSNNSIIIKDNNGNSSSNSDDNNSDISSDNDSDNDNETDINGWVKVLDNNSGRYYYYNKMSRESRWVLPNNGLLNGNGNCHTKGISQPLTLNPYNNGRNNNNLYAPPYNSFTPNHNGSNSTGINIITPKLQYNNMMHNRVYTNTNIQYQINNNNNKNNNNDINGDKLIYHNSSTTSTDETTTINDNNEELIRLQNENIKLKKIIDDLKLELKRKNINRNFENIGINHWDTNDVNNFLSLLGKDYNDFRENICDIRQYNGKKIVKLVRKKNRQKLELMGLNKKCQDILLKKVKRFRKNRHKININHDGLKQNRAKKLLEKWNLKEYYYNLMQNDDSLLYEWNKISENELKNQYNFKPSHAKLFLKKRNELSLANKLNININNNKFNIITNGGNINKTIQDKRINNINKDKVTPKTVKTPSINDDKNAKIIDDNNDTCTIITELSDVNKRGSIISENTSRRPSVELIE